MDFNDGNWAFRGAVTVNGKAIIYPRKFTSKSVAIDLSFRDIKKTWYTSGYIVFYSNGLQVPKREPVSFGRSNLTAPDFPENQPYQIQFKPAAWLGSGRIKFWEFIPTRKALRPEPIDPTEFTAQEIELLQSSGLDPEKLRLSPESLEVVLPLLVSLRSSSGDSVSSQLQIILTELRKMASTDIRSMLQQLETVATQTEANTTGLASQTVLLNDVRATAVVEKNFTIEKAAFVLEGSIYRATVNHQMSTLTPGVSIYDNDGDLQLAEFIAIDVNNAKLELTASQYRDNSFPLKVNLQARNAASSVAGQWKLIPTGDRYWRLKDGALDRSADGVNVENAAFVTTVTEAVMSPTQQRIYLKKADGSIAFVDNGNLGAGLTAQTLAEYEAVKASAGSVVL